jgi:magnesium transporter
VKGLLDYAVEKAGGLTNSRYARLRPQMSVDEAVSFLRRDARDRAQAMYYAYVTDSEERLLGVVTFRDLLITPGDKKVQDVMRADVITAPEHLDQAALNQLFTQHNLQMIPVVDSEKRIKRVVTLEDFTDVG